MIKVGLLSDTHGYLPARTFEFFDACNEVWHAGDFGNLEVVNKLMKFKPLRAVYGNIDGADIRSIFPVKQLFRVEDVKVFMTHIGGYPGRYNKKALKVISDEKPRLFISGHSHILKVMFDKKHQLLHINPGAAGISGIQKVITMVRFVIDSDKIQELEIFEKELRK